MSEIWSLSSLCRCCHADGTFKSLYLSYEVKGQREQYSVMLKDTFDIVMDPAPPNASTMVCDDCIYELRKASRFKEQVLDCERKFAEYCLNEQTNQMDVKMECKSEDNSDDEQTNEMDAKSECQSEDNSDDGQTNQMSSIPIEFESEDNSVENSNNDLSTSVVAPETEATDPTDSATPVKRKRGRPRVHKTTPEYLAECAARTRAEQTVRPTRMSTRRRPQQQHSHLAQIKKDVESAAQKSEKQTENEKDPKATKDKTKTTKSTPAAPSLVLIGSDSSKSLTSKQCGELVDKPTSIRAHIKAVHPKTPGDMHKCHFCDEEFPSQRLRSKHTVTHFADNKFDCHVCGKTYTNIVGLETHLNEHTKRRIFICDYCNKEFVHKKSLRYHILIHMGTRVRLVCALCGVQCNDNTQLRIHTDTVHEKLRPYSCEVCGMWYASKRHLKYHETLHTCEVCARHFPGLQQLKDHQKRQHEHAATLEHKMEGQKIYTCPHCDAKFESRGRYISHRRTFVHLHLNKKIVDMKLKCEYCDRIFEKKYAYNRHMNLHLGGPSFSCEICDSKFTDKSSVIRHMKRHEPSGDKQICTLCGRKVRNMEKHLKVHTGKAYECQYCNKKYPENNTLTRHIKTKHLKIGTRFCPLCPAKFTTPGGLKRHNSKVHNGVEAKPPPVEVDPEQIRTFRIDKA